LQLAIQIGRELNRKNNNVEDGTSAIDILCSPAVSSMQSEILKGGSQIQYGSPWRHGFYQIQRQFFQAVLLPA
jgi:hypothetical protein